MTDIASHAWHGMLAYGWANRVTPAAADPKARPVPNLQARLANLDRA